MTTDTVSPFHQDANARSMSTAKSHAIDPQWLSLPAAPESVRRARRFAMHMLAEVAEVDSGHVDDAVLVVSELVTNASREVARLGTKEPVHLGIAVHLRWTHLLVVDTAPTLPEETPHGPLAGSGRGIPIVRNLAAMTWVDQGEREKTIHVVVTRTNADLTPQERREFSTSGADRIGVTAMSPRRLTRADDALLRPSEVAAMFGVRPPTIARWAREGRLTPLLTPGGHRRYSLADIRPLFGGAESDMDRTMIEDAVRLYNQGWTIRQVAARFDLGYGVMRRVLNRHTTLRTRGGISGT